MKSMKEMNCLSKYLVFLLGMLLLLLSPLSQSYEVLKLYTGGIERHDALLTPVYLKIIKDLSLLTVTFYFFYKTLKSGASLIKTGAICITAIFIILSMILSLSKGHSIILSVLGLHWIIPLFLFYFASETIEDNEWDLIIKIATVIFIIHFILQLSQVFFSTGYYGSVWGVSARNPGIYIIPNTASLFSIFYFLLCLKEKKLILAILSIASTILTGSGTGIIVLLVVFSYRVFYKYRKYVYITSPIFMALSYLLLVSMFAFRGGGDYVNISLGTRFEYIYNALFFWPMNFGEGTNIALSLGLTEKLMDSTYASILLNTGYVGFFAYILVLVVSFIMFEINNNKDSATFVMVIVLTSFTNILMSISILNIVLPLSLAYYFFSYNNNGAIE